MKVVLDCSAAMDISRQTKEGMNLALLPALSGEWETCAPELFYAEVGSASSKYYRAGLATVEEAREYAEGALDLVDTFVSLDELYTEAFAESLRLKHSIYDMFYFVLARRCGALLVTLDKRLNALCEQEGVNCIHTVPIGKEDVAAARATEQKQGG